MERQQDVRRGGEGSEGSSLKKQLDLFTVWDAKHVITFDPKTGIVTLGDEKITPDEVRNLKGEVDILRRSRLWPLIEATLRARAVNQGINASTEWNHVLVAKAMLVDLDLIESILHTIETIK